jgi:hypothetical protein
MHLVGYLYEDYHDARSLEHKVQNVASSQTVIMPTYDSNIHKQELYSLIVVYGVGVNTCRSRVDEATTYNW